jgi:adenylate cyclase
LGLLLINLPRSTLGVTIFAFSLLGYLLIGVILFSFADFILPLSAPMIISIFVAGSGLTGRIVFAEQDKRNLRQRLAGVMSPERLDAVMGNWESLLHAERPRKEAAVLFSDVRGFTNASETLLHQNRTPEMVNFLSAYLDVMGDAAFKEGGVIFDVIGDGLMILFGLPESFPDYGLRAVRAAIRMGQATNQLQTIWPLKDIRPLQIGIGVNCGSVVDAVVGRGRRINYQVIGDPVNTAARIESHCKVAMEIPRPPGGQVPENVTILISRKLFEQVCEHVLADESIPPFEARGKSEPLEVVRVLGLRNGEIS